MTLYDAMTALQAEAAGYPAGVRVWMKLMAISFFSGLLFAPWRREALWVVLMAIATMVLLVVGKVIDPSISRSLLGSVIHLLTWPLVLWLLWSSGARDRRGAVAAANSWRRIYTTWLIWVSSLIVISLALDAKYLLGYLVS